MKAKLDLVWFSSLAKILPDENKLPSRCSHGEALREEQFNFQLMVHSPNMHNRRAEFRMESDLPCPVTIRQCTSVPVSFTGYPAPDRDVIFSGSRLCPDQLKPLLDKSVRIIIRQHDTLFFSAFIDKDCPAGDYSFKMYFTVYPDECEEDPTQKMEYFQSEVFHLKVLPVRTSPQRLKVTQWLHPDCLSAYYKVPMWSPEHWNILENFIRNGAAHGMNMLLVPLFSLMLNVMPGKRRELTQLLIISRKNGKYVFDFSRFDHFIRLAQKCGIQYFEISHFFSQWGAAYAPPVEVDNELLLDGSCPGDHRLYRELLETLLPEFKQHLYKLGIAEKTVFHCSDEPSPEHADRYRSAMQLMRNCLPVNEFHIMDAINDAKVYEICDMDIPVPLTMQLHRFRSMKLPERWTYYCCSPVRKGANRFIHFPSSRNRILGILLWKYNVDGFLHWGYNFYFEALSRYLIDPEKDPTSGEFYSPGDAFLVYPAPDGTVNDSLRHEVFQEALQDFRALDKLASLTSPGKVRKLLSLWAGKLTMTEYPRGEKAILLLRHRINQEILKESVTCGQTKE